MAAKTTFVSWFLLAAVLLLSLIIWAGNTGRFNSPDITYTGRHAQTGQVVAIRGCRPERLMPDGSCDQSFRWNEFFR